MEQTARQIIRRSMLKAGVLGRGETPTAEEASDGLMALNDLFGSVSNEPLMIYVRTLEQFDLVAGKASYTIGPGGDFNTARPVAVVSGFLRSASTDYQLTQISEKSYDGMSSKSQSGIPAGFIYEASSPVGRIVFDCEPSSTYEAFLRLSKAFSDVTLDTVLDLPPGWNRFLVYNLAMELAPEFAQGVSADISRIAQESKDNIERTIARNMPMDWDAGPCCFDIYTR